MIINNLYTDVLGKSSKVIDNSNMIVNNKMKFEKVDRFQNIILDNLNKVNSLQIESDRKTNGFITGEINNLHEVMIATEEARLSLELAVQIRNKCVEAFKEVSNMQL